MNWFTNTPIGNLTEAHKRKLLDDDGGCEHVETDINLAVAVRMERDTWGPVGSYVVCAECDKKADEAEDNEEHVCADCLKTHKAKDGIRWKWYDFYAAQGDTPLCICNECRKLPKHIDRLRQDAYNYEQEFGSDDD